MDHLRSHPVRVSNHRVPLPAVRPLEARQFTLRQLVLMLVIHHEARQPEVCHHHCVVLREENQTCCKARRFYFYHAFHTCIHRFTIQRCRRTVKKYKKHIILDYISVLRGLSTINRKIIPVLGCMIKNDPSPFFV